MSDFDEHPEFFMTESGTFEGYGAGKIQGKVVVPIIRRPKPFRHSTLNPLTSLSVPKGESSVSVSSKPKYTFII